MSEVEKKTIEELELQFKRLAFTVGNLQYEVVQRQKDLDTYINAMRDLAIEGAKLKEQAAKEAAEAPVETKEETKNES